MDFYPGSFYHRPNPVYWPALANAIMKVINAKSVHVRLLASRWMYTGAQQEPGLLSLLEMAKVCAPLRWPAWPCKGSLTLKQFEVPGWQNTSDIGRRAWPGHSRCNHVKYIVTDATVNIGTSNMVWGYMFNTAGMSFQNNDGVFIRTMQSIFEQDWNSQYASPITGNKTTA